MNIKLMEDRELLLSRMQDEFPSNIGSGIDWQAAFAKHPEWQEPLKWQDKKMRIRVYSAANALFQKRKRKRQDLVPAPAPIANGQDAATKPGAWSQARRARFNATVRARRTARLGADAAPKPPKAAPKAAVLNTALPGLEVHHCPRCACTFAVLPEPLSPGRAHLMQTAYKVMTLGNGGSA